jgi:outer membrane protein OmpA-like peptidoglycan-associated protein
MYLTEFKKKLLASFGIVITLAIMGSFVFAKGPFKQTTKTVEALVISTTLPTAEPEVPSTGVSCQGTSILFDINKTDSLISLNGYQDCFDWFSSQYKLGIYKTINVIGRSSCDSSKENGTQISQDRADLIARSLVDAGVPAFLINPKGIGFSDPIGDCQTTKGAIANRSVTITGVQS